MTVVFGGRNTEHDISRASARAVLAHLDRDRYEVSTIYITRQGEWRPDDDGESPDAEAGGDVRASIAAAMPLLRNTDVVFPVLHGRYGEDGTVQGLFDLVGVRYVGSGVRASAAAMDKEFTKKLLAADSIEVAGDVVVRRPEDTVSDIDRWWLGLPAFVKPARGGSSIGVSRITDWDQLPDALAEARKTDPKVLVEAAQTGREIDVGVLQHPDGRLQASPPLEIKTDHEYFDYTAKYAHDGSVFSMPALDPDMSKALCATALRVFELLDCSGLLRVDFFVDRRTDGSLRLTVNEVNAMPGLTAASQFPRMWQQAGIGYPQLLDILIATAGTRS